METVFGMNCKERSLSYRAPMNTGMARVAHRLQHRRQRPRQMMRVVYSTQGLTFQTINFQCYVAHFSTRTFHPVERSDDIVVFDHEDNNGNVSIMLRKL